MSTVFRDLCAELVEQLQRAINDYGFSLEGESALMFRARKELAQPEREGPSLAEVDELAAPTPEAAPVATDEELLAMRSWSSHGPTFDSDLVEFGRNCYNLGRQHGAAQSAPSTEFAADKVIIHCPETCWIEIRRIADGKVIYSNHRKGTLMIPVDEPPALLAPAGGLVERVAKAIHPSICADPNLYRYESRAAIREVAEWLDQRGMHGCALWLREEVDRA
jgi:hypothetical protein